MDDKRYAILIDSDNISSQYIGTIMDEISKKGTATIKRIYGDWTNPAIGPWKETNLEYSLSPIQQYSYTKGKNATDSAMIIDAMDILYSGKVDGFCLVSSDSDFTRLAARLREAGMDVIGMGKQQTPQPFVKACTEFKFIDLLSGEKEKPTQTAKTKKAKNGTDNKAEESSQTPLDVIRKTIISIVEEESNEDGWILASQIGDSLKKRFSDFDSRNFGFKKLGELLESFDKDLVFEKRPNQNNLQNPSMLIYVRLKKKR